MSYIHPYNGKSIFFPRLHEAIAYCDALNLMEALKSVRKGIRDPPTWGTDEMTILYEAVLKKKETSPRDLRYIIKKFTT